jgi:hypothetical protein
MSGLLDAQAEGMEGLIAQYPLDSSGWGADGAIWASAIADLQGSAAVDPSLGVPMVPIGRRRTPAHRPHFLERTFVARDFHHHAHDAWMPVGLPCPGKIPAFDFRAGDFSGNRSGLVPVRGAPGTGLIVAGHERVEQIALQRSDVLAMSPEQAAYLIRCRMASKNARVLGTAHTAGSLSSAPAAINASVAINAPVAMRDTCPASQAAPERAAEALVLSGTTLLQTGPPPEQQPPSAEKPAEGAAMCSAVASAARSTESTACSAHVWQPVPCPEEALQHPSSRQQRESSDTLQPRTHERVKGQALGYTRGCIQLCAAASRPPTVAATGWTLPSTHRPDGPLEMALTAKQLDRSLLQTIIGRKDALARR